MTLSYHYAVLASLNVGVLMSTYALKPIITSISFYLLYDQKLKNFEIIGIFMCSVTVCLIAFSHGVDSDGGKEVKYTVISLLLIFGVIL